MLDAETAVSLCLEVLLCKPTGKLLHKKPLVFNTEILHLWAKLWELCSKQSRSMQPQSHLPSTGFLHPCHKWRPLPTASHPLRPLKHWCQTSPHMLVRSVPAQRSRVFPSPRRKYLLSSRSDQNEDGRNRSQETSIISLGWHPAAWSAWMLKPPITACRNAIPAHFPSRRCSQQKLLLG